MSIKPTLARLLAATLLAVCMIALSGASASKGPVREPDKLVIISTTDVKGKTSPCG